MTSLAARAFRMRRGASSAQWQPPANASKATKSDCKPPTIKLAQGNRGSLCFIKFRDIGTSATILLSFGASRYFRDAYSHLNARIFPNSSIDRNMQAGSLKTLYGGQNVSSWIVIIPSLGEQQWAWQTSAANGWLKALAHDSTNSRIYLFDHKLQLDSSLSWKEVLTCGTDLLFSLMRVRNDNLHHPIIFLCLGLGGLMVKQALWKAHQQDNYRGLERLISGLIFIGTPHSRRSEELRWKPLITALKPSIRGTTCVPSSEELEMLAAVSSNFEEIDCRLPILTAYEISETKMRERGRHRSRLLVGREFALINAKSEELFGIEADYHKLCHFDDESPAYLQVLAFIQSALRATESRLSYDRSSYDPAIMGGSFRVAGPSFDILTGSNFSRSPLKTSLLADIPVIADYSVSRRGPRLPCHKFNSHTRNSRFYGRREVLKTLEETLLPSEFSRSNLADLKTFALCGLGGVGKTEIAVEFMSCNYEKFDAVFWLQADKLSKLAEDFGQIAVYLGLEEVDEAFDQDVSRDLVKAWLAKPTKSLDPTTGDVMSDANWLLVFDNVESPDILKDFWPHHGSGSVLITSRDPFSRNLDFAEIPGKKLQPFDAEGAAHFLIKLTCEDEEVDDLLRNEATEIADKLGGLPLAITQIAGIIRSKAISLAEFLEDFHEGMRKELQRKQGSAHSRGYEHSLASCWAFERLGIGPSALFDVLSLLDSGPIGEDILRNGAQHVKLTGYPKTSLEYQDARSKLIHSSLITRNQRSCVLLVHRLTQYVARVNMAPTRLQQVFEAAVSLVSAVWVEEELHKKYDTTRWREREAILPHVRQLRGFYKENRESFTPPIQFARLLNNVAWYFHERGRSDDHKSFSELAQFICESQTSKSIDVDRLLIEIHYSRGSEASQTNQPKLCLDQFTALLELCHKVCNYSQGGRPDEHLASAYNELGVAYMMNKMYAKGSGAFKMSISTYESLPEYTKNMTSFPMANLGVSYWLQNQLLEATDVLLRALRAREDMFGPDDTESVKTGRILHALGNVCASQDNFVESREYHRRALAQYRSTIGHSHHRTADACHKVAEHYIRERRFESARKLLEQALRVYSSRVQLKREKARSSFKMGRLLQLSDNQAEAGPFLEDAALIYKELNPKDYRQLDLLTDSDFDDLVSFWSK